MSILKIDPYAVLNGSDGLPLDAGYVYIGLANQDPKTNPQTVYWDAALTVPAVQPFRTVNGRIYRNGAPALIYGASSFSIQVLDKAQRQVFIALNVAPPVDNPVPIAQGGTGATTAAGALINLGVVAALILQTYTGYTTAGTGAAFTLTPAPAIVASPAKTRFNVTFHADGAAAPTLNISAVGAKLLKQYDGAGVLVPAVVKAGQISDVIDDGSFYVVLDQLPPPTAAAAGIVTVRQTVQFGARDINGQGAFISAGAGLTYNIAATGVPVGITFAAGFGAVGPVDLTSRITADAANQGALGYNNTNYLHATYIDAGSVTWGNTKAPPQYGDVYAQNKAGLLQFGGIAGSTSFTDDFGNSWIPQGAAKIQTNQFKFGTGGLGGAGAANALNGTTDFIRSASFNTAPDGSWSARAWVYATALPGAATESVLFGLQNSAGGRSNGFTAEIFNNAGTIKFRQTAGVAGYGDIVTQVGTTTPLINAWYFVEMTFDGANYRLYVNGVQEASTASATVIGLPTNPAMHAGGIVNGAGFVGHTGYLDKFEFLPYCDHPAGVPYAVPTGAPDVTAAGYAQEWYDIGAGQMKRITAASAVASNNPTFGAVSRCYVGEADTGGAGVTAVRTYAYNGRAKTPEIAFPGLSTVTDVSHNLGVAPLNFTLFARLLVPLGGHIAGTALPITLSSGSATDPRLGGNVSASPLTLRVVNSTPQGMGVPDAGGSQSTYTATNARLFSIVGRGF